MLSNGLIRLWENPEVTQLNKLPGRASFESFPEAAMARARKPNPWKLGLDGVWQFVQAADIPTALKLATAPTSKSKWKTISVPGHPELQGFGQPHYTNVQMPFPEEPPRVPGKNPTGVFRRRVKIPASWKSLRTILHFGSAESLLAVWIDGVAVGMSKGSRLPAEFDVTSLLRAGSEIEITALVAKWSDSCFIEDQDMWWMSGLPRSVALLAMPKTHLADLTVRPVLDGKNAFLEVEAQIGCEFPAPDSALVTMQLLDPDGRKVSPRPLSETVNWKRQVHSSKRGVATFRVRVPRCRLWSAESPSLYTVVISVKDGKLESCISVRTGFRSIEVRGGDLLINGRRVLIFGVNRHSHDDVHGRAVPRERMLEDIRLMKRFHFNAVRCSHYPPDPYWLELCDEHGLYVIDEADAESHDFHNALCRDPRYASAWLDRAMRMVQRDKNHASVILWSLGNESGYGPNHDAAAGWIRHTDPARPLHYEGAISMGQSHLSFLHGQAATDIICPMYTSISDLQKTDAFLSSLTIPPPQLEPGLLEGMCRAVAPASGDRPMPPLRELPHPAARPIILCEYSHAMGNSNGSLHDYFALFRSARHVQGGFIWEWADHGIRRTTKDGRIDWVYGGDFGDTPNDANFVCDGLVGPNRGLHPAMFEHRHLAQPVWISPIDARAGRFLIENRQDFIKLDWLRAEWSLLLDGHCLRRGMLPLQKVAPGQSAALTLPLGSLPDEGELHFNVTFFASKKRGCFAPGDEVAFNQISIPQKSRPSKKTTLSKVLSSVSRSAGKLLLSFDEVILTFDEKNARLASISLGDRPLVTAGPALALWRAAVDNDGLKLWTGQANKPLGRWRKLGLDKLRERPDGPATVETISGRNQVVLRQKASGRNTWNDASFESRFEFDDKDTLLVSHRVSFGSKDMIDLPRVGCTWTLAPELTHLRYLGLGPHENYPDRQVSARIGIFQNTVAAEFVPYVMPQEHGRHGDTRWLELSSLHSTLRLDPLTPIGFNVSHLTAADLFQARHLTDLTPRPEVLLTLDAAHRGVGTGSCGPDTLPEYKVREQEYVWSYRLRIR